MSFAASAALQSAIFARLSADSALDALIGGNLFDAAPTGTVPPLYVLIGDEAVRDWSDKDSAGAAHDLVISVITTQAGFLAAKQAAAAIADALGGGLPVLSRGTLVALNFLRAKALRTDQGATRRIDLRFRALIADI